jgi:hypothetical protein
LSSSRDCRGAGVFPNLYYHRATLMDATFPDVVTHQRHRHITDGPPYQALPAVKPLGEKPSIFKHVMHGFGVSCVMLLRLHSSLSRHRRQCGPVPGLSLNRWAPRGAAGLAANVYNLVPTVSSSSRYPTTSDLRQILNWSSIRLRFCDGVCNYVLASLARRRG